MNDMILNEYEMTIMPVHWKHKGFVDCEGNELRPGDTVVVGYYGNRMHTGIITRFTPARLYYNTVYVGQWKRARGETLDSYEHMAQRPSPSSVAYRCGVGTDADRMMPQVLKVNGAEV